MIVKVTKRSLTMSPLDGMQYDFFFLHFTGRMGVYLVLFLDGCCRQSHYLTLHKYGTLLEVIPFEFQKDLLTAEN